MTAPITGFLWQTTEEAVTCRSFYYIQNQTLDPNVDGPNIFIEDVLTLTNLDSFDALTFIPILRTAIHADCGGLGIGGGAAYSFWLSYPDSADVPNVKVGFTFDVGDAVQVDMTLAGTYCSNENYCIEGTVAPGDPDDWMRYILNENIPVGNAEMSPSTLFSDGLAAIQNLFDEWAKVVFVNGITTNVTLLDATYTFTIQDIPYQFIDPECIVITARAPGYITNDDWNLLDTTCP